MSLIKELKKIIKKDPENIDIIRYIVFEYLNFFFGEYVSVDTMESFYSPSEFYSIKASLSNVFEKTSENELPTPGELYEKIIPLKLKKKYGQVYTPSDTISHMVGEIVDENQYLRYPHVRYLDPACGSGYFLIALYRRLRLLFDENKDHFKNNHGIDAKDIDRHIIDNNLCGFDIDGFSCLLTAAGLNIASRTLCHPDIRNEDYLFCKLDAKVQAIIGNPPYIGHKNLEIEYKKELNDRFAVYNDKSDISYCFFEKAEKDLIDSGKLLFITSRYFIEADNARELRGFIKDKYGIRSMVDYAGITLFKNTGVSPVIISLVKNETIEKISIENIPRMASFTVRVKDLDENPWRLVEMDVEKLYNKIVSRTKKSVSDSFRINQGIITGLDKAFVVTQDEIKASGLEEKLLVNWLKGSAVKKYGLSDNKGLKLIYTNDIEIDDYPNTRNYLEGFRKRLEKRRECQKGYRRWFDLQWGRTRSQFERDKILFPYKAKENRFAIDQGGNYFSADVYMMTGIEDDLDLTGSMAYFNSEVFEFLVKLTSKKIGRDLYEYYPYNILKLPYFEIDCIGYNKDGNYDKIDTQLQSILDLDGREVQLIKKFIERDRKDT